MALENLSGSLNLSGGLTSSGEVQSEYVCALQARVCVVSRSVGWVRLTSVCVFGVGHFACSVAVATKDSSGRIRRRRCPALAWQLTLAVAVGVAVARATETARRSGDSTPRSKVAATDAGATTAEHPMHCSSDDVGLTFSMLSRFYVGVVLVRVRLALLGCALLAACLWA